MKEANKDLLEGKKKKKKKKHYFMAKIAKNYFYK